MSLWDWRQALAGFAEFHGPAPEREPGSGAPSSDEHRARLARIAAREARA